MLKALGISIYIASLLVHKYWGVSGVALWVALYHFLQNTAMLAICCDAIINKSKYTSVFIVGMAYFASASIFYLYAFATSQYIYFSNSGAAGEVLSYLVALSILISIVNKYANSRRG